MLENWCLDNIRDLTRIKQIAKNKTVFIVKDHFEIEY